MRKILMVILVLAGMSGEASAKWFLAGGANLGYLKDHFGFVLKPSAGYEFNDRWAVGIGLGMGFATGDNGYGYVEPYVRFNCWNNDKVYLDLKGRGEFLFNEGLGGGQIGITPSIRCSLNDHWQLYGDVGLFGTEYLDDKWRPAMGVGSLGIAAGVIYNF
ncbi:MAG: hypothetical protein K2H79_03250 [Bacteroidaceae bacterium]|nr:hypothetical protein [Bacteroidaceae bacterium]